MGVLPSTYSKVSAPGRLKGWSPRCFACTLAGGGARLGTDKVLNRAPATGCQGSSESSAPPDSVRLSPEQPPRPEMPEARRPARAGGQLLFFWVVMFQ